MDSTIIIYFILLLISVVIHEVSHGYAALFLGDPTARDLGRLSINPIRHIDPVGSILVPIISSILHVPFGWAKPVPFNPANLRNQRWGEAIVAVAGPVSNIIIALIFSVIFRMAMGAGILTQMSALILGLIVIINVGLALFNLLPVPPLDGSKILFALIPDRYYHVREWLERYQLLLVIIIIYFAPQIISPVLSVAIQFLLGTSFGL